MKRTYRTVGLELLGLSSQLSTEHGCLELPALHRAGLQLTFCLERAGLKCCCFVLHFLGIIQCQPMVSTHQKLGKDFMTRIPNIKFIYWSSLKQWVGAQSPCIPLTPGD